MIDSSKKDKTILLTGAGGPAPSGMIQVLRKHGYRIITVDMLKHSPAFYLSDKSYVVPPGNSDKFLSTLKHICKEESVDAIVSVVDEELPHTIQLEKEGIQVIQPLEDFTNLCIDKYKCMKRLAELGINAPQTWLFHEIPNDVEFPIFAKPIVGRGSRGIGKINSFQELEDFLARSTYKKEQLMFQPFLTGTEYTVSVVVWRDGDVQAVVPKEIVSKIGVTKIAIARKNTKINDLCIEIQQKLKANGPFNVQLKLDRNGQPYPFEINPRFSTSITLTMAAGVDELGGIISQALFGKESFKFGDWKDGTVLIRHTADQFISYEDFVKQSIIE